MEVELQVGMSEIREEDKGFLQYPSENAEHQKDKVKIIHPCEDYRA